ncbi:MAG TPA: NAD-dependent epimerase/dehydratase family protein [Kiritimatiellia bacterium]|nr:NAD-dependent epimerase/dehydratase family protein [Kiritimatiellia bacterium]HPS08135.1 NAD-dependent epimerase/dehydratase family protein [Kiritimatiellia bacterium]
MRILVTGSAGFIGFHLAGRLLRDGHEVAGLDNFDAYYSVRLKRDRHALLISEHADTDRFRFYENDICDRAALERVFAEFAPECVINLAAQAGVRYSITDPFAYQKSNLEGFLSVLECCRQARQKPRLIYASSSSVYGGNRVLPFSEEQAVDHPVSLYAATKKANEMMAHVYTHLYGIQTIGLRFFTVYGPWYRPDMAMYLFADAMTRGDPVRVFNRGKMSRDFTYVDDIVEGVVRCVTGVQFAPYEIFNIGNNRPELLLDMIGLLAEGLAVTPRLELLPMQAGDVPDTWASIERLHAKTGYAPQTPLCEGVPKFVAWYRDYVLGNP